MLNGIRIGYLSLLAAALLAGCGKGPEQPTMSEAKSESHNHEHGDWWCAEHGVREEVCALCDTKVAADLKAKGDWCKEHDRPESQCFACHPELEAKFAAQYEAKYGEKPPKPQAE